MPTATTPPEPAAGGSRLFALETWLKPNALVLVALWLFATLHFHAVWPTLGVVFRDTDDMMRLVEVRDFLAGQGWFDLHQYRLDPPAEVPMHWSRFVDLPIALLIRLFGLVFDPMTALRATMFVWPALPLLPVLWSGRTIAVRLGGAWAAVPAVYLMATHGLVVGQFVPGRIDHHNVQIALTLALLTLMVGPAGKWRGALAGFTGAVMMAVGMETLPFLMLVVVGFAALWVIAGDENGEVQAFGLSLAASTAVVFFATLPPSEWGRGACDALSIDYLALAVVGGVGLAGAAGFAPVSWRTRAAFLVGLGVVTVAAYAAPEPACLKGPFGQLLPEVRTVWLDGVNEVQPWIKVFHEEHVGAIAALMMPLIGLLAFGILARDGERRRNVGFWVMGAAQVTALAIGLMQLRTMVYANALAVPMVAAAIGALARAGEARGRSVAVTVLAGSILVNGMVLQTAIEAVAPASWRQDVAQTSGGMGLAVSAPPASADGSAPATAGQGNACYTMTNFAELAAQPRGLVAAEVNLGPSILASTGHSVLAAPYHRMQRGILDAHHILNRPLPEAFAIMAARNVDYLVVCTDSKWTGTPGGILDRLQAGSVPTGLEEIPGNGVVRVFRVHAMPVLTAR